MLYYTGKELMILVHEIQKVIQSQITAVLSLKNSVFSYAQALGEEGQEIQKKE